MTESYPDPAAPRTITAERVKATYIAAHPEPRRVDYPCRQCSASVGEPCTFGRLRKANQIDSHAPRYDHWFTAHAKWVVKVDNVFWEAWEGRTAS